MFAVRAVVSLPSHLVKNALVYRVAIAFALFFQTLLTISEVQVWA
ncbi:hypothetical protein PCIT_a4101 [Pseudoalteromonas citrea]|uniref:Uncharacterized protein n=1 Tax=Pseudoalteromonas citrea TaxID=43655 RepID=A0AAD4AIS1_9GAMM|nr:hypothetical protein PCIT_a4101 [Pseudoalteromonas citrea]